MFFSLHFSSDLLLSCTNSTVTKQFGNFTGHSIFGYTQEISNNVPRYSAVASMRPTEALASVKFWRISPIIFILQKRSSDMFNASWYYKDFRNSVNILWKNYHIIDVKGLRTLTQIFFEQILIKTIGEVNGHPDYVACFWLVFPYGPRKRCKSHFRETKVQNFSGGAHAPEPP